MQTLTDKLQHRLIEVSQRRNAPLLSVDTSSSVASLALVDGRQTPFVRTLTLPAKALPSEGLFEAMVTLVGDAGLSPRDLCALAVGLGPGSFTGLRVSLSSVKGIALATGVELYGFNSSVAVALSLGPGRCWVIGDARRQSVHLVGTQWPESGSCTLTCAPACLSYETASAQIGAERSADATVHLVGDGVGLVYPEGTPPWASCHQAQPEAAWGLYQVAQRIEERQCDDVAALAPLYLQQMPLPQASYKAPV